MPIDTSDFVPNPVDVHVGARLRGLRKDRGISQEALAKSLNLTFQQVQKYEKGTNRVSASKLYATAQLFGVPVSAFFEGLAGPASGPKGADDTEAAALRVLSRDREIAGAAMGLSAISDPRKRRMVLDLIQALASSG